MKRRKRILPPPGPGLYVRAELVELPNDLYPPGTPMPPAVEVTPAGPPCEVVELESDDLQDHDELAKVYPEILRIAEGSAPKYGLDPKELADETVLFLQEPTGPRDDGPCVSPELIRDLPRIVRRVAKKLRWAEERHRHAALSTQTANSHQPDPAQSVEASDFVHQVLVGIAQLSSTDRKILRAFYFDNRTYEEIARETGLSPPALRQHLKHLLQRVREMPRQE